MLFAQRGLFGRRSAKAHRFELVTSTREIVSVNFNTSFGFLKKAVMPARYASRSQSVAESMMIGVRLRCTVCLARLTSSSPPPEMFCAHLDSLQGYCLTLGKLRRLAL
jgi:hypothetical protein